MTEHVLAILRHFDVDPAKVCVADTGERTAFEILEAAIQGAMDDIEAASDTEGRSRYDAVLQAAIEGLREHYPCLCDEALVSRIKAAVNVNVPDTGNHQLDYEQVRDQVERLANQIETQPIDGRKESPFPPRSSMKTTRIIVPVQHADDMAADEVAAAINQLLDVGFADAQDTANDSELNNPDAQRAAALNIGPPEAMAQRYAAVAWTSDDVQSLFAVSDEQAAAFLVRHEHNLQERMTERGWEALETLGRMDGLRKVDDDDEPQ